MKEFNIENWNRRRIYNFFKNYEDPFFNIVANLEVTNLYKYCKQNHLSFSLACLYVAIKSVNEITEFKLRFKDNKVYLCDKIYIGSTILNNDNTFAFCYFKNEPTIFDFDKKGKIILKKHKKNSKFEAKDEGLNLVHCSTLPWVSFTAIKHARKGDEGKSGIPKIVFGKLFEENKIKKIPFSVEVHHALMDGFHVALLFNKMQQFIDELV